jgi:transposase
MVCWKYILNSHRPAQNQLHALKHSAVAMKEAIKILERLVIVFDKELVRIKRLIEDHVNSNSEVKQRIENICSVKGLGLLSVATVIAETNGFELFENIPQVIGYAGYDVEEDQSGNRNGKTKISKKVTATSDGSCICLHSI